MTQRHVRSDSGNQATAWMVRPSWTGVLAAAILAMTATPCNLLAQKKPDKVPTDKLAQNVLAQKIFHKPFPGNQWVKRMVPCGGTLFIAVGNWDPNAPKALKIYRLDHAGCKLWIDVTPAWTDPPRASMVAMACFKDKLFVGTQKGEICCIDPLGGAQPPVLVNAAGGFSSMAVFKDQLYAVSFGTLYRTSDGSAWENLGKVVQPASGSVDDTTTLEVFGGYLYVGCGFTVYKPGKSEADEEGIQIWRTADGKGAQLFKKVSVDRTQTGVQDDVPQHVHAMKKLGGHLYIGGFEGPAGYVYRTDGTSWEGIKATKNGAIVALEVHDGKLYAGQYDYHLADPNSGPMDGQEMLFVTTDGTKWSAVPGAPLGEKRSQGITALASHAGRLYFGTADLGNGGEVFEVGATLSTCQIAGIHDYGKLRVIDYLLLLKRDLKDAKPASAEKSAEMIKQLGESLKTLRLPDTQTPTRDKALGQLQVVRRELEMAAALVDRAAKVADREDRDALLRQGGEHADRAHDGFTKFLVAVAAVAPAAVNTQDGAKDGGPGVHGRVFALDKSGELAGLVPGAKIEFTSAGTFTKGTEPAIRVTATADAKGYYTAKLTAGTYIYKVTAAGFKDEDAGRQVELKLTKGYAILNFSLSPGKTEPAKQKPLPLPDIAYLSGHVWEKTGKDLVGVPGAVVKLYPDKGGRPIEVLTAAAGVKERDAGFYEVVLPAGTYRAEVMATGFDRLIDPKPITIVAFKKHTRDFELTRAKVAAPKGQGIHGTITFAELRDPRVRPKMKISFVPVSPSGPKSETTAPDAEWTYKKELPPKVVYRVVAECPGYEDAWSGRCMVYAGRYTTVNLVLKPRIVPETPKELLLKVIVRDAAGELPQANVLARKQGEALSTALRGVTDAKGEVHFRVTAAGKYDVLAQKASYVPAGGEIDVTPSGKNKIELTLEKEPPPKVVLTRLSVHVVTRDPKHSDPVDIDGAQVRIVLKGREVQLGSTRANGLFVSKPLEPGTYALSVSKSGFDPAFLPTVPVGATDEKPVLVVLKRTVEPEPPKVVRTRLMLEVVDEKKDPTGKYYLPIDGARVRITRQGSLIEEGQTGPPLFPRAHFIAKLAPDTYDIEVSKTGFKTALLKNYKLGKTDQKELVILKRTAEPEPPPKLVRSRLLLEVVEEKKDPKQRFYLPIDGARVRIALRGTIVEDGQTGPPLFPKSQFLTTLAAPDTYDIEVSKTGFKTEFLKNYALGRMDQRELVVLKRSTEPEPPPATIFALRVRVQEKIGAKIAPATRGQVIVYQDGTRITWGTLSSAGEVTFRLPRGNYRLEARTGSDFEAGYADVQLNANATETITLARPEATLATLHLRILTGARATPQAVSMARVVFRERLTGGALGQPFEKYSDQNGYLAMRLKLRTTYVVEVSRQGYHPANQVEVKMGARDMSQDIFLSPVLTIIPPPPTTKKVSLTLQINAMGKLIGDAKVTLLRGKKTIVDEAPAPRGLFVAKDLDPGNYTVIVTAPGYERFEVATSITRDLQAPVTLRRKQ